ncbi:histone deacetylase 6/10 [Vigna unguiculata]|uniref:Histone deacetylase 6/10 n=1 Tax=Vigna unguiculata TaxID=3917 RepID=A0A4D6M453_VIGUN|nr:histone deacetylase 6/10 [Vigna unguiculata]
MTNHVENPDRIKSIWNKLKSVGVPCAFLAASSGVETFGLSCRMEKWNGILYIQERSRCCNLSTKGKRYDFRVLFFSVHRHESGNFYPTNDDGFYTKVGEAEGARYNINVAWGNANCGDADYFPVWDHILLPVAKEFNLDIIIVSAGFDAAIGDPLGGCRVTADGYSVLLEKLMNFAEGRIVLIDCRRRM